MMPELNHSSECFATMVQPVEPTIATMVDFAARLRLAMDAVQMDEHALAKALDVSYQAIKKAINGKSKSFGSANNARAAQALGVRPDWLALGTGEMRESNTTSKLHESLGPEPAPTGLHATLMALGAALSSCDVADREIASAVLKNLALQPERAAEFADKLEGLLGGGGHEQPLLRQNGR